MKKLFLLVLLTFALNQWVQAQQTKLTKNGKLFGLNLLNDQGQSIKTIEPIYEDIQVFSKMSIGLLGDMYFNTQMFNDTEFIEVPIDPTDYTRTKTDTIINDTKPYYPGKLILAKKGGKWGIITMDGEEKAPFIYDQIAPLQAKSMQLNRGAVAPFLLCVEKGKVQVLDQSGTCILPDEKVPAYIKNRGIDLMVEGLELSFFGDYLLVNEGGTLFDSLVKTPAVKRMEKGKLKTVYPAMEYHQYLFKGGKFNVWQFSTNSMVFPEYQKNIIINLQDEKGNNFFEGLNVKSIPAIDKFHENNRLGIIPAKIAFTPQNN